ncbi:hypothetical protein NRIC_27150 [Enterococcus florum]|uniref:Uncharacterized protein n=1 Tax=Enterococcus florum TaxID=2480627 RepID=A0A4P5PE10_9ENTE|nr:ABC transporter permease subunit [Enterococcus florum]GCF94824.1 hypothetical protein NRIC_27150 [Enterococcus florum]
MRKLLYANLQRLWLDSTFWLMVLAVIGLESVFCINLRRQGTLPMDLVLFVFLQCMGILIAILLSLYYGTDYQEGTIRNKLVVGHKRSSIYLANLLAGFIAVTVLFLIGVLVGGVLGAVMYEPLENDLLQIILVGVVGWLACLSFAAIFNLVGMLSNSKSVSAIVCILGAFGLLFTSLYIYQRLAQPGRLTGTTRTLYEFLFEVNPNGQILQAMSYNIDSSIQMMLYSFGLIMVFSLVGLFFFKRKDLK